MNDDDFTSSDIPTDETGTESGTDGIPTDRRPLGFWLRAVDALITREFAIVLAEEGISRRDWMLMNALAGDVDASDLGERMARRGGKHLRGLEKRGWADESGDGTWTLTDEGRMALQRLSTAVGGIRGRVAGAVTPEDFATTMASLEAIARELGWDEPAPRRGFGRGFGPGFRRGFGPGFGNGDAPGFGPGAGPGFRPGFGHGLGWRSEPGHHPGFGPGFGPGFDPRPAWAESSEEDGCRGHGGPRHGHHHPHGRHGGHGHGRHSFERGFDAGYARGSAAEHD